MTIEGRITPQEIISRFQEKGGASYGTQASELLSHFCYHQDFTFEEASELIKAAAEVSFPEPYSKYEDAGYSLIVNIAESPYVLHESGRYLELIKEIFPKLKPPAQKAAIQLLARLPEREGAISVMRILNDYSVNADAEIIRDAILAICNGMRSHKQHAEVYFPDLFKFNPSDDMGLVYHLYYDFCTQQKVDVGQKYTLVHIILNDYHKLKMRIAELQQNVNEQWGTNWDYQSVRHPAGLLLDVLGYHSHQEVIDELTEALTLYGDPLLIGWTIIALLRLEQNVPQENVYKVAADDETRKPFYSSLKELGKTEIFPDEYRTIEAFARSDLINWLTYPTELGTVPDEIELMAVIGQPHGNPPRWEDWYVFRYRTDDINVWNARGWMAGWSGPYPRDAVPGHITTPGGTFSHFEEWDSKSPEEHLALNPLDAAETDGCVVIWKKEGPDEKTR